MTTALPYTFCVPHQDVQFELLTVAALVVLIRVW